MLGETTRLVKDCNWREEQIPYCSQSQYLACGTVHVKKHFQKSSGSCKRRHTVDEVIELIDELSAAGIEHLRQEVARMEEELVIQVLMETSIVCKRQGKAMKKEVLNKVRQDMAITRSKINARATKVVLKLYDIHSATLAEALNAVYAMDGAVKLRAEDAAKGEASSKDLLNNRWALLDEREEGLKLLVTSKAEQANVLKAIQAELEQTKTDNVAITKLKEEQVTIIEAERKLLPRE